MRRLAISAGGRGSWGSWLSADNDPLADSTDEAIQADTPGGSLTRVGINVTTVLGVAVFLLGIWGLLAAVGAFGGLTVLLLLLTIFLIYTRSWLGLVGLTVVFVLGLLLSAAFPIFGGLPAPSIGPGLTQYDFGLIFTTIFTVACIAPGFLDSDLKAIISTQPRPGRRSRVALEPGCDSRPSPASTARCTSA